MKISEVETIFKEVFEEEDGRVSSVETVFELSEKEDFYKMVISIQNLITEDVIIIHTKFIFKVDLDKINVIDNSFIYLYEINCVYEKRSFDNAVDLKQRIEDIIESRDFGEDLVILSDFIEAPAMFLNYYLRRDNITDYSVYDVEYEPKFKTTPCDRTTFDFKINVNNNYEIDLSISKKNPTKDDEFDTYYFHFRFLDEHKKVENDTLKNLHFFIGSQIAKLLDEKLK